MVELSASQTALLERLVSHGFRLVAFPLYASAIGVRRENFAALLVPESEGRLRLLGKPCCLIEGNLSVLVRRGTTQLFVWKSKSVEATPDLLAQLKRFSDDIHQALSQ